LRVDAHPRHHAAFPVPKELFEEWARRDPIERFRSWLRDNAELTDDEEDEITAGAKRLLNETIQRAAARPLPEPTDDEEDEIPAGVKRLLNEAIQRAEESPLPDPATVLDGVFATPDELET